MLPGQSYEQPYGDFGKSQFFHPLESLLQAAVASMRSFRTEAGLHSSRPLFERLNSISSFYIMAPNAVVVLLQHRVAQRSGATAGTFVR